MRMLALALGLVVVTGAVPWGCADAGSSMTSTGTILVGALGLGVGQRVSDISHTDGVDLGFGERVYIDAGIQRVIVPSTHACEWDATKACGSLAAAYYLVDGGPLDAAALWILDPEGHITHEGPVGTDAAFPATDMLPGDYAVVVAAHTGVLLRFSLSTAIG